MGGGGSVWADGVRSTDGFGIDDDRGGGEWRQAYPKGRKQVWFNRAADKIEFPGEGLRGEKLELARRTRPDALFLSVAAQFNHEQLLPVFNWFRDNLWLISPEEDKRQREGFTRDRVLRESGFRDRIVRVLQVADLGVTGFDKAALSQEEIRLLHRAGTREVPLDYGAESLGTRSWFGLIGVLVAACDEATTVRVDEQDSSLHAAMSAAAVHMVSDPDARLLREQVLAPLPYA